MALVVVTCMAASASPFGVDLDVRIDQSVITPASPQPQSASASKAADEAGQFPVEGVIEVSSSLRLRQWPWGPVISLNANGTRVTVTGEEGEFYKVSINGAEGYLHKNYVSTPAAPASKEEPFYPGSCRAGGFISSGEDPTVATAKPTKRSAPAARVASGLRAPATKLVAKKSVLGARAGDGTAQGALTWAADQLPGGNQRGLNSNNGKISKDKNAWNSWCLAFCATAWGRKAPELRAASAIKSYNNFKRSGKIRTNKNPPAGAVMFTGTTSTNPYGHIFMATGKTTASGEPIVVTSGSARYPGIKELPLSRMIGNLRYLGWAMP